MKIVKLMLTVVISALLIISTAGSAFAGANIAAFSKLAEAMKAQGVV